MQKHPKNELFSFGKFTDEQIIFHLWLIEQTKSSEAEMKEEQKNN